MTDITQVPNIERDNLIAAIEQMKRNLPILIEHQQILATLAYEKFVALVKAGFTEMQALELCKNV